MEQDREIVVLLQKIEQMELDEKVRQWIMKSNRELDRDSDPTSQAYRSMGLSPAPYTPLPEDQQLAFTLKNLRYRSNPLNASPQSVDLKPPDIIKYNVVAPDDIALLFHIFFDKINPFFSLLDPELHTPNKLIWSSPFLFTVICALASRFITEKPSLYSLSMEFARDAAGKALVDGTISIDVCQAYLLLAVYPRPGKKWDKDRSWILMGVAIRMGLELKLHEHPPPGTDDRECANRIRTWLNCFCVDGAHATAFGKLPMSSLDDAVSRSCTDWYRSSRFNLPFDLQLVAYVDIIALMAQFRKAVKRFEEHPGEDAASIITQCEIYDEMLAKKITFWKARYAEDYTACNDRLCRYRCNTTEMIGTYLRLVILSMAFPYAVKKGIVRESYVAETSIDVACTVIKIMVERLYPTGILRFAMEANFLYVAFAAAFLINLLRPKFLPLLGETTQTKIIKIVGALIGVLGSNDVAMDERHTPALYHRFLSNLLKKYDQRPVTHVPERPGSTDFVPEYGPDRRPSPPHTYMWPDTGTIHPPSLVSTERAEHPQNMVLQSSGEAEMDFSLNHFVTHVHGLQYEQIPQDGSVLLPQSDVPRPAPGWEADMFSHDPSGYPVWPPSAGHDHGHARGGYGV